MNSAFLEGVSHPVRKLVEHIVPQGGQIEEADEASGSDAYLSSEDTAEYKKVATPLESVLVATQAAQAAELEWDAAGCTLDTDSCDKEQTEELVLCNAVEGNICCFSAFEKAHLCSLADWNFGDGEAIFKAVTKISSFRVYAISRRGIVQLGVLLVPFSFSSL